MPMWSIWADLWDLFFPECCIICDERLMKHEHFLCFRCLATLPHTNLHLQRNNEVERNFWGKFPVERAASFLYYAKGSVVRQLLYELKYYGNKEIGGFLGRYMAAELLPSGFFEGIDYILPVPLHRKKERLRGYNQSEWLAKGVGSVTSIPVLSDVMERCKYTETQTHKGLYERWENVCDIFVCNTPAILQGKHVLLIDDVLTTGATIVSCSDALKDVADIRISVVTLALAGQG